jgi:hypothetical protein
LRFRTINTAFDAILGEIEATGEAHTQLVKAMEEKIVQHLTVLVKEMEGTRKRVSETTKKKKKWFFLFY